MVGMTKIKWHVIQFLIVRIIEKKINLIFIIIKFNSNLMQIF